MEETGRETQKEKAHDLQLNPEVLQRDDSVSTSLCDRFGIYMYSEEFLEKEKNYNHQQKENDEKVFQEVLYNTKNSKNEEAFQQVIRAERTEVIKADYGGRQDGNSVWLPTAYGLLGALLAGTVLFFIEKKRRRHRENNSYNQE